VAKQALASLPAGLRRQPVPPEEEEIVLRFGRLAITPLHYLSGRATTPDWSAQSMSSAP